MKKGLEVVKKKINLKDEYLQTEDLFILKEYLEEKEELTENEKTDLEQIVKFQEILGCVGSVYRWQESAFRYKGVYYPSKILNKKSMKSHLNYKYANELYFLDCEIPCSIMPVKIDFKTELSRYASVKIRGITFYYTEYYLSDILMKRL